MDKSGNDVLTNRARDGSQGSGYSYGYSEGSMRLGQRNLMLIRVQFEFRFGFRFGFW